jgi:hypothetical protein
VKLIEFSSRLDGDTVPGDSTVACLGLGKILAIREVPYAQQPLKRPRVEERAYVEERERVKLLRKAMGDKRFFVAWQHHRLATRKIMRERIDTNKDFVDRECMPESLREAQERAAKNALECKSTKMDKCLDMSPERLMRKINGGLTSMGPILLKQKRKQVKAFPAIKLISGEKGFQGIISSHASTQCHVCSRPISTLLPNSCQCLDSVICI